MTILLVSVYSTANAATIYGCQDKNGKMSFSNSACSSNSKELFKKFIPGSDKAAGTNKPVVQANTTAPVIKASQATLTLPSAPSTQPKSDRFFAKNSFWYTPLPNNVTLATNSDLLTEEFLRQKTKYFNTVTISPHDYSSPVYTVGANVKTVQVQHYDCMKQGYKIDTNLMNQWSAVPIPEYAVPAGGRDSEMTIYQPSTDTIWEFWRAKKDVITGQWSGCWGGRLQNISSSDGTFTGKYGASATSIPFIGGQITAEELQSGVINHVIGLSLVELEHWDIFSYPAHRSDGSNPSGMPNRIAEGQRFRLDPNVNVDSLKMHPIGKIIAKAAQKYGFVVWDKSGSLSMRARNSLSYTTIGQDDPYVKLWNGSPNYFIMNNFPWDKLQFLPKDYGKP